MVDGLAAQEETTGGVLGLGATSMFAVAFALPPRPSSHTTVAVYEPSFASPAVHRVSAPVPSMLPPVADHLYVTGSLSGSVHCACRTTASVEPAVTLFGFAVRLTVGGWFGGGGGGAPPKCRTTPVEARRLFCLDRKR